MIYSYRNVIGLSKRDKLLKRDRVIETVIELSRYRD